MNVKVYIANTKYIFAYIDLFLETQHKEWFRDYIFKLCSKRMLIIKHTIKCWISSQASNICYKASVYLMKGICYKLWKCLMLFITYISTENKAQKLYRHLINLSWLNKFIRVCDAIHNLSKLDSCHSILSVIVMYYIQIIYWVVLWKVGLLSTFAFWAWNIKEQKLRTPAEHCRTSFLFWQLLKLKNIHFANKPLRPSYILSNINTEP